MSLFSDTLLLWYATHKRKLPWRDISDPYKIWVSEIILQQTRIAQGIEYYKHFIEAFPTVKELANAEEDKVMHLWQGLGYYSRVRNMHAAAKKIVQLGQFPKTFEEIRQLQGVGIYTASAICSFAYNLPYAVVDGNVYRVLSRYFGINDAIDCSSGKKKFTKLAAELLPPDRSADYNQALMDFGALQCTPQSPDCNQCIFFSSCVAFAQQRVDLLPIKAHRTKIAERFFVYIGVNTPDGLWLHRRGLQDIWGGLYEIPLLEFNHRASLEEVKNHPFIKQLPDGGSWRPIKKEIKHILSHRIIHAFAYSLSYNFSFPPPPPFIFIKREDIKHYALHRLVQKIIAQLYPISSHQK